MSRILVLGAGGMLGHKLCQLLPRRGHEVIGTIRKQADSLDGFREVFGHMRIVPEIDALDDDALAAVVSDVRPEAIVNCVGIVKQLPQANNALISVGINSSLPHKLAELSRDGGCKLIHISTDCVFSGRDGMYDETSPSDATDLYGKSKYLGETGEAEAASMTLRTSFIGRELHRPTHGLLEWFLNRRGGTVKGFRKAIYSGLTSHALSGVIALLIEKHTDLSGVWQVAGEPINKYALLLLIREIYDLDVDVLPDEAFQCDRSMKADKFRQATGWQTPSWRDMIVEMHQDETPYDKYFSA